MSTTRITDLDPASLAGATVVKALNHIGYHDLEQRTRPPHAPVRLESLRAGRVLQPGHPVFGATLTRPEFERAIDDEEARSLT